MNFNDLPHDVLGVIADNIESLTSFRLVCKKFSQIRPGRIRINRYGKRITSETSLRQLEFLCDLHSDTVIIFEHFSALTLERTRSFLRWFNRLHFSIYEPTDEFLPELISETLTSLTDMVELNICVEPLSRGLFEKIGVPSGETVIADTVATVVCCPSTLTRSTSDTSNSKPTGTGT